MQFRIISDLHVDINHKYYNKFKFDPNAYYLIAGDIAGSRFKVGEFLNHYKSIGKLNKCVLVAGNHLGYDREFEFPDQTKEACINYLTEKFPIQEDICFMENQHKEIGEDIIVIGCTLYTNFKLFNNRELAMRAAMTYMNDFRYVQTYSNLGGERLITPLDYETRFNNSLEYIKTICEENPDKKIVVVTHHGPSRKSLSEKYANDILSAAYVSDLEDFIKEHKNIKVWCHGHTHSIKEYSIEQCQVQCYPFGYWNENGMKLTRYIGKPFEL